MTEVITHGSYGPRHISVEILSKSELSTKYGIGGIFGGDWEGLIKELNINPIAYYENLVASGDYSGSGNLFYSFMERPSGRMERVVYRDSTNEERKYEYRSGDGLNTDV